MQRQKYWLIIPYLLPSLLLYGTFVIYPYLQAMYVAFTKWKGLRKPPVFVGLENFQDILKDEHFWNALKNNGTYLIVLPILTLGFALFLAFMITQKVRCRQFLPCDLFLSTSDVGSGDWYFVEFYFPSQSWYFEFIP